MRIVVLAVAPALLFAAPAVGFAAQTETAEPPAGSKCIQQTDERRGCDHRRPEPTTS